ncbi:transcription antitermination factor NusB [Corynebacterium sp. UBA2622]|uniref:transcription antitermination factor NusB n=1 Tax=Corynebacterium sp. UBA2622 TaxID=1946393 RepID=UPI0025C11EC3|nr:transcription antitermination factor NusB [Corynebacterium sp. UBA2622]
MPDYKRHGARYRARRRAVDILFEAETRDMDPVAIVDDRAELSRDPQNAVAPVADYTREIIVGAAEKLDDIDDAIERFLAEDWEMDRLPAVDRQILRVATWEILFNDEVDPPISIANALEMATEYGDNAAPPYIHAVLDDIIQWNAANAPAAAGVERPGTEAPAEPAGPGTETPGETVREADTGAEAPVLGEIVAEPATGFPEGGTRP